MAGQKKFGGRIAIVYMVAGLSSRFGGKLKQFAQVGLNGETLIEISMRQAIGAGFDEIIFIVGEKTEKPFLEKFGTSYAGIPISYAKQIFDPAKRDKPWGTVDALVSAKEVIKSPFVVCNGDDIYGEKTFLIARKFLEKSTGENECVAVGFEMGKVLPEKGKTNRGLFITDSKGNIKELMEVFDVEKSSLHEKGLNEKSPASMNVFGLKKKILALLEQNLLVFKKNHEGDRKAESLLPVEMGALIREKKISVKLLRTNEKCLGVTNPGDEEAVRKALFERS